MAVPASQIQVNRLVNYEDQASSSNDRQCPSCDGSGWIKVFTPWGCPTSTRCTCVPADHPVIAEKPIL